MTYENYQETNPNKYKLSNGQIITEVDYESLLRSFSSTYKAIANPYSEKAYGTESEKEKITNLYKNVEFEANIEGDSKYKAAMEFDKYSRLVAYTHWNPIELVMEKNRTNAFEDWFDNITEEQKAEIRKQNDKKVEQQILKENEQEEKENDLKNILQEHEYLKEDEIKNLNIIDQEEFNTIVDLLYKDKKPDYIKLPSVIKLPKLNDNLANELNLKNSNYFIKTEIAHVRPQRKSNYGQALRKEEFKGLLENIKTIDTAYVDKKQNHKNFFLVGLDEQNNNLCNKVVFNKDKLGNYIVTISKVNIADLNDKNYEKVGVGVAPTIWRSQNENSPLTRFVPSTTLSDKTDSLNLQEKEDLSSNLEIENQNNELDIWTEKSEKDNKRILELTEKVEQQEKTIQEQNQLLYGNVNVEVNGKNRNFPKGLVAGVPNCIKKLAEANQKILIQNQKIENLNNYIDSITNTKDSINPNKPEPKDPKSPSDDGMSY